MGTTPTQGLIVNHAPTRGKEVRIYVYLLGVGDRTKPTDATFTVASGGAAKGATSITLDEAAAYKAEAGQVLQFVDSNGAEYLARLTEQYDPDATAPGDITLAVAALPEAIPAGAIAQTPTYFWDRTDASVDTSYDLSAVTTFNTGDNQDGVITGFQRTMSLPGLFYPKNAALKTLQWAADRGRECWLQREMPAPSSAFSKGEIYEGPAVVDSVALGAPGDGFASADVNITWLGSITYTDATPTD